MKDQRRRGGLGRTIAAFGIGAAAGSVVALLFAPASGQVTRKRLTMRVRNTQRALGRTLGQARKQLAHRAEYVREAATDWIAEHVPHGNGNGRHAPRRARAA